MSVNNAPQQKNRCARQTCPADMPGRHARQTCPADMPGRHAQQTCPEDVPGRRSGEQKHGFQVVAFASIATNKQLSIHEILCEFIVNSQKV
jgi:hypothetical protein